MSKLPVPVVSGFLFFLISSLSFPAHADVEDQLNSLAHRLDDQQNLITDQQRAINAQADQIREQKKIIDALTNAKAQGTTAAQQTAKTKKNAIVAKTAQTKSPTEIPAPPIVNIPNTTVQPQVASQKEVTVPSMTPPTAPASVQEPARPQIDALADQGGILSQKGMLTYENTLEYTNTTRNLFTFNGVELAQVVLVGALSANTVEHQIVQETARFRLGLTNRLEADVHIPYVYRNDNLTNTNASSGLTTTSVEQGYALGDIDAGLAYQLNDGKQGWPFLIGNLRYKADNADGPYDVPYNSANIATRLPTGTGFQTAEASVTAIKVSDPAVLFGNLGYVYDMSRNINKNFNQTYVGLVQPGDAINALVGMAFAINQDTSFSLGYKHSYVFPTIQHSIDLATGDPFTSSTGSSQVGALTLGLSYALSPATSLNFNLEAGVTNDAPDVHLTLRIPYQIGKIF